MTNIIELPWRGKTRTVTLENKGKRADKKLLQGGDYLIHKDWWPPIEDIQGNDPKILNSPVMQLAFNRILQVHKQHHKIALFSLCTATRPYSVSRKWSKFVEHFEQYADLIIMSNGGIIPIEYEGQYPYLNYDAHGEKKYDKEYIRFGIQRLKQFLEGRRYEYVLFNFRHNMRNYECAKIVGPWAVKEGLIRDYAILPTKEHYMQSRAEDYRSMGYGMYPEIYETMFNPVLEKLIEWNDNE